MHTKLYFLLIPLVLAWSGLLPTAHAVSPAPDGGYPNQNTAEGEDALFSLTDGSDNTANGYQALYSNTSGFQNTGTGRRALYSNTTGSGNTAQGSDALYFNTAGDYNTANGSGALSFNHTGTQNTANGFDALFSNTIGDDNTASGLSALGANTTGANNTATGAGALFFNTTGCDNVGLGFSAGRNLTTGDNNIDISNQGLAGESNTIRIGRQGTQTTTYIAGIAGTGVSGTAVKISADGQLGTPPSARRFKEKIKPMNKVSEGILALKPVCFRYKKEIDPDGTPQFGLVAEEVEKVNPDLVAHDAKGRIYTVRYDAVNAMLLNEFLKEHKKVQELKTTVARFESRFGQQEKQIEALTSGLQKVNAQFELSRSAPEMVAASR